MECLGSLSTRVGEVETGRSLKFTGQPVKPISELWIERGREEPCPKEKIRRREREIQAGS